MEENFIKGNINTKYLSLIYKDGFNGRNLNEERLHSLLAIASSIFLQHYLRSFKVDQLNKFPNESLAKTLYLDLNENLNIEQGTIIKTNINYDKTKNCFDILVNDSFQTTLSADFSLNALTIDFPINDNIYTIQLISINYDGTCKIQFEGTIVITLHYIA